MKDETLIKGLWSLFKHSSDEKNRQIAFEQKKKELEEFARSQGQQTIIYEKQLEIAQRQLKLMEEQTLIQKQGYWVQVIMVIATILMAVATIIMAFK